MVSTEASVLAARILPYMSTLIGTVSGLHFLGAILKRADSRAASTLVTATLPHVDSLLGTGSGLGFLRSILKGTDLDDAVSTIVTATLPRVESLIGTGPGLGLRQRGGDGGSRTASSRIGARPTVHGGKKKARPRSKKQLRRAHDPRLLGKFLD